MEYEVAFAIEGRHLEKLSAFLSKFGKGRHAPVLYVGDKQLEEANDIVVSDLARLPTVEFSASWRCDNELTDFICVYVNSAATAFAIASTEENLESIVFMMRKLLYFDYFDIYVSGPPSLDIREYHAWKGDEFARRLVDGIRSA